MRPAAAFAVVVGVLISRHELWVDELNAWAIAAASPAPWSLDLLRGEGRPILWFAVLWPLTRVTHSPAAMQVLAWALAVGAAYLSLAYAPFPRWLRVLLAFGYYPVYELGTIARNYSLEWFLLAVALALVTRPRPRWWAVATALALLANTHVFAVGLAGAVLAAAAARHGRAPGWWRAAVATALGSLLSLAVTGLAPVGQDDRVLSRWWVDLHAHRGATTVSMVWQALVPIPRSIPRFWNTNVLFAGDPGRGRGYPEASPAAAVAGLAVLLLVTTVLARRSRASVLVWIGTVGFWAAATYLRRLPHASRHLAVIWMALVAAAWFAGLAPRATAAGPSRRAAPLVVLLTVLGLTSVVVAAVAGSIEGDRPFGAYEALGGAVRRAAGSEPYELLCETNFECGSLVAVLDHPAWNMTGAGPRRYWRTLDRPTSESALRRRAEAIARRTGHLVVVFGERPLRGQGMWAPAGQAPSTFTGEDVGLFLSFLGGADRSPP